LDRVIEEKAGPAAIIPRGGFGVFGGSVRKDGFLLTGISRL
jgi:hypothetical protein